MTSLATTHAETPSDGRIVCEIDGARTHAISLHLKSHHPDWTVARYEEAYPNAPLFSPAALQQISKRAAATSMTPVSAALGLASSFEKKPFHEIFGLGKVKAAMRSTGEPMMIDVVINHDPISETLIPEIDPNYVFPIEHTKDIIISLAIDLKTYVWGYHGTGKTTLLEQVCARTKRPFLRVQHTIDTESADIVGQWTVSGGDTIFQPGPLVDAMLNGWVYCADEYDFAIPSVTAVYQSVLEGKALLIKNAPPHLRSIKPHPNFRFVATGNTNGVGDESGLYQGTQMGNAANYSRFAMTIQIGYMDAKIEAIVVSNQAGCEVKDAAKIVEFASHVRNAYTAGKIGSTISPRELINTALIGIARADWRAGLDRAFLNRVSRVDKEAIGQFAQRVWG